MKNSKYILVIIGLILTFQSTYLFAKDHVIERVYVQTDKQTYLAGELLWLKMIVSDKEGRNINFSKIGYVELLDGLSSVIQAKIELRDGIGEGWIELPVTLPTGYYRLVGYTRYMQNEGEAVYFNKTIALINTFKSDETILVDSVETKISSSIVNNNILVSPQKAKYTVREKGEVKIEGLPKGIRSLSISIVGREFMKIPNEVTISTWKKEVSTQTVNQFETKLLPEYEGHIISSKLVNIETGETAQNKKVIPLMGYVGDEVRVFGGQLDNQGNVTFYTTQTTGVNELATVAISPEQEKYRIDILPPYAKHSEKNMPQFVLNKFWKEQLLQRSVGLQVLHTYMADSLSRIDSVASFFKIKPDRSYLLDEYTRFTTMEEVIIEFVSPMRFRKMNNKRVLAVFNDEKKEFSLGNSLILLDGVPITDHEMLFRYDPLLIKKIDVYKGMFVFGGLFFDGVGCLYTYNNNYQGLKVDQTTQFFDYEGTRPHRYFYAPAYMTDLEKNCKVPDYRHTLLWEPNIKTEDKDSIIIPFTSSDLTGEYQITVEGLTNKGDAIYGTSLLKVE